MTKPKDNKKPRAEVTYIRPTGFNYDQLVPCIEIIPYEGDFEGCCMQIARGGFYLATGGLPEPVQRTYIPPSAIIRIREGKA